jgi:hypothetical protein
MPARRLLQRPGMGGKGPDPQAMPAAVLIVAALVAGAAVAWMAWWG